MTGAYYNELDPFAAAWLRELMKAKQIPDGEVDERSIELVQPDDLRRFGQCHFFAGIGGWAYALRLAGWPDDRDVWTGSCPCQPWSVAGFSTGTTDSRHLWPAWFGLIEQRRPATVFGEQVASEDGKYWCDLVCADLETLDYAFGAAVLPATCVGAPEGRHRLWFVADATGARPSTLIEALQDNARRGTEPRREGARVVERLADADGAISRYERIQRSWRLVQLKEDPLTGFWACAEWLRCDDGKIRPVEPKTFPLAHGVSARVGRLRAYGNAIVPQVAQAFIEAYMDTRIT